MPISSQLYIWFSRAFFVCSTLIWAGFFFALTGCGQELDTVQLSNVQHQQAQALSYTDDTGGAGIYAKNVNLTVTNSQNFSNHFTSGKGGAIYAENSQVNVSCDGEPTHQSGACFVDNNVAGSGGAFHLDSSTGSISRLKMSFNAAEQGANVIAITNSAADIEVQENWFRHFDDKLYYYPTNAAALIGMDYTPVSGSIQNNWFHLIGQSRVQEIQTSDGTSVAGPDCGALDAQNSSPCNCYDYDNFVDRCLPQ